METYPPEADTFGRRLRLELEEAELSQSWLARQIATTQQTVGALINDRSEPRLGTVVSICKAIGVSADSLACLTDERRLRALESVEPDQAENPSVAAAVRALAESRPQERSGPS